MDLDTNEKVVAAIEDLLEDRSKEPLSSSYLNWLLSSPFLRIRVLMILKQLIVPGVGESLEDIHQSHILSIRRLEISPRFKQLALELVLSDRIVMNLPTPSDVHEDIVCNEELDDREKEVITMYSYRFDRLINVEQLLNSVIIPVPKEQSVVRQNCYESSYSE